MNVGRREFLGALGLGCAGIPAALAPRAHQDADLEASLSIVDYEIDEKTVPQLTFTLTNERSRRREPIQPSVQPWGQDTYSQTPWDIIDGPDEVRPSETATYTVRNGEVPLHVAKPALLVVYDRGTEERVFERFTPHA